MKIEKFKNKLIAFDYNSDMVNATDMIKCFPKKKMNNFLRQKQTQDFIEVLEERVETLKSVSVDGETLIVRRGGSKQGTWMNKLLALKFAAWLSPEFELFVFEVFHNYLADKINNQQRQLDYFWDKSDQKDLYN